MQGSSYCIGYTYETLPTLTSAHLFPDIAMTFRTPWLINHAGVQLEQ